MAVLIKDKTMLQKSLLLFFGVLLLSACTVPEISIERVNFISEETSIINPHSVHTRVMLTDEVRPKYLKVEGVLVAEIKSDTDLFEYAKNNNYEVISLRVKACDDGFKMNDFSEPRFE